MAEISFRDQTLVVDMLLAARDALSFIHGISETDFIDSRQIQNAVIRSLEIIGEAASKMSSGQKAECPEISWREIVGMRHRLVHG